MTIKFKWETEFKETEIGEIPRDWEVKKIKEIGEVGGGSTPSTKIDEYWDGDIPWLTPKDLREFEYVYIYKGERNITEKAVKENSLKIFPKGTVLLTTRAPIGYVAIAGNPITTNQGFRNIISKKVISEYLYYYLRIMTDYLVSLAGGSTFGELTGSTLKQISIPYPSLSEQSRIATVLSWFDELIENKKRQNEILEKMAMAIFKSWFVDFEPFKDEEFVYNEELGKEIPKGWEVKRLGEVVSSQYGYTASTKETGKIKFLRIMDINKSFVIDWDLVPFCDIKKDDFMKYKLEEGDIVISRIGDIGKVAIIESPPLSVFASYLIRLQIRNKNLSPYYLYYWLKSQDYQEYIHGAADGSTRQNTNAEVIKNGPILIPPSSLIKQYENIISLIRQKIILNQKQIMTLRNVRDTLLPLLVFGKLRVEEI